MIIFITFFIIEFLSLRKIFFLDANVIPGHNWDWTFPNLGFLFKKIYILSNYSWKDINLGTPSCLTTLHLIPDNIITLASYLFDIKPIILTLLILVITISFISFKKLLDIIVRKTEINYIPSFLYAFSPFLFCEIIGGSWYTWVSYAFAPMLFMNLLNYIKTKALKQLIGFLVSAILVMSSMHNFVLVETIIFLFLVHNILVKRQELKKALFRYSFAHMILVVFSLYWILPFSGTLTDFYQYVFKNPSFDMGFQAVRYSTQNIPNILSLIGYLDRNIYYHAIPDFILPLFIVSVFSIWLLIVSSLVLKKQFLEYKAFPWLFILLLSIFLIKGGNPPFGGLTMWFYNIFPIMKLYRGPTHMMFLAAFITPVLAACSLNYLIENSMHKKKIAYIFGFCIFIWISGWWYNGDLGHEILKNKQKDYVDFYALSPGLQKIYERNEKELLNHRILFLPAVFSPLYLETEYQNKAQGGQAEYMYLKNPTFTSELNLFANQIENSFCEGMDNNYANYLRLFSVKDIVLRYDIAPLFTESATYWNSNRVKKILDSSDYFEKFLEEKYEIGYSLKPEYFLPHIYSSTISTIVDGDRETLMSITDTKYLGRKPVLLFTQKMQGLKKMNAASQEPEITFKKINPTKYVVKVERARGPFWLVFSESFHNQWHLYYLQPIASNLQLFKEIVAAYPNLKVKEAKHIMQFTPQDIRFLFEKPLKAQHHLVNGYANGWYIEPEKLSLGEDFTLVLYFWPQSLFYLGLIISGLTLIGCVYLLRR